MHKDNANRAQDKTNSFVFYAEVPLILFKVMQTGILLTLSAGHMKFKKRESDGLLKGCLREEAAFFELKKGHLPQAALFVVSML